jgi:tRNA-intron endonuclease
MDFVVRPGLKFGADFTVYRRGPGLEHSLFVVHVFPLEELRDPVELVKAGRLSHSVRKTFVLASVEADGTPTFLMLKWFKP